MCFKFSFAIWPTVDGFFFCLVGNNNYLLRSCTLQPIANWSNFVCEMNNTKCNWFCMKQSTKNRINFVFICAIQSKVSVVMTVWIWFVWFCPLSSFFFSYVSVTSYKLPQFQVINLFCFVFVCFVFRYPIGILVSFTQSTILVQLNVKVFNCLLQFAFDVLIICTHFVYLLSFFLSNVRTKFCN